MGTQPEMFSDPLCPDHGMRLPCFKCVEEGRAAGRDNKARKMEEVQTSNDPEFQAAKDDWMARHLLAAHRMCLERKTFTGDQVLTGGYIEPPPGNAKLVGPANRRMAEKGWACKTNYTRESTAAGHHAQPRQVWVSLIYGNRAWKVERCRSCEGFGVHVMEKGVANGDA